jgi:hypothetical protein
VSKTFVTALTNQQQVGSSIDTNENTRIETADSPRVGRYTPAVVRRQEDSLMNSYAPATELNSYIGDRKSIFKV